MCVQIKTCDNTDKGPAWISRVRFSKIWQTAYWRGRTLARGQGFDSNFHDVDTQEEFWLSGPNRNETDGRYSSALPEVDQDAREPWEAFLEGAPLPGRECR